MRNWREQLQTKFECIERVDRLLKCTPISRCSSILINFAIWIFSIKESTQYGGKTFAHKIFLLALFGISKHQSYSTLLHRVRVHSERTLAAGRPVAYYPRWSTESRNGPISVATAIQTTAPSAYPGGHNRIVSHSVHSTIRLRGNSWRSSIVVSYGAFFQNFPKIYIGNF